METNIISIGNSKGVIIPSKLLKLNNFNNLVNIDFENGKIIISPSKNPREGWQKMIENDIKVNGLPDRLLPDFFDDELDNEWQW